LGPIDFGETADWAVREGGVVAKNAAATKSGTIAVDHKKRFVNLVSPLWGVWAELAW
jgi:hypothetical protein